MEDHPEYSRNTLMDFIKLKPKDIEICDVTLRDGEQAAGIAPGSAALLAQRHRMSMPRWMRT